MRDIQSVWKTTPQERLLGMGFLANLAFPQMKRQDTPFVELFKYAQNAKVATVVQDGATPVLQTYETGTNQAIKMPTTSDKFKVNTAEIYLEPEYSEYPSNIKDGIRLIEAERRKRDQLALANRRWVESMAIGFVFGHGEFTYTPDGGSAITINYGLLAELQFDVGAADDTYYWGGANATPEKDVQTGIDAMIDNGGVPYAIVGRPELVEEFIESLLESKKYDSKNAEYGTLSPDAMMEFVGTKAGTFAGVQIFKYSGVIPGTGKLVPADKIAIVGKSDGNSRVVGKNEETFPTSASGLRVTRSADGMMFAGYSIETARYIAGSTTALPIIGDTSSVATIKVKA